MTEWNYKAYGRWKGSFLNVLSLSFVENITCVPISLHRPILLLPHQIILNATEE